jgi:hypothetical protein
VQDAADPVCGLQPLAGDRLSLYIELNVAFKLTVEDAAAGVVPQAEDKVCSMYAVHAASGGSLAVGLLQLLICSGGIRAGPGFRVWATNRSATPHMPAKTSCWQRR